MFWRNSPSLFPDASKEELRLRDIKIANLEAKLKQYHSITINQPAINLCEPVPVTRGSPKIVISNVESLADLNALTKREAVRDNPTDHSTPSAIIESGSKLSVCRPNRMKTPLQKKFKCSRCPYQTDFKSHLTRHENAHGDITKETVKCDKCSAILMNELAYRIHLKRMHPESCDRRSMRL